MRSRGEDMKKYVKLLKYELKTLYKDPMNLFMILYPFLMLAVLGLLVPEIVERAGAEASRIVLLIGLTLAFVAGSYISGVLLGFSLIENKDENTILGLAVTPASVSGYAAFKIAYGFVISLFSNLILLGGLKLIAADRYVLEAGGFQIRLLDNLSWGKVIFFSLANSLFVPAVALVLGSFAKNKIEGFAFLKAGAIVIFLPVLAHLDVFKNQNQYILGVLPNFWTVKGMINAATSAEGAYDLPFYGYMLIGIAYYAAISGLTFRLFFRKNQAIS